LASSLHFFSFSDLDLLNLLDLHLSLFF